MTILGPDRFAIVGKIGKAHALAGELKASFDYTLKEGAISQLSHLFIDVVSPPIPFFIETIKPAPQEGFYLVNFESITNKEEAAQLTNTNIAFLKEEVEQYFVLPNESTSPFDEETDLVGFTMIDRNLGNLGSIDNIMEMPHQLLAQMEVKGQEVMIPLTEATTEQIDEYDQVIYTNLPEGLLDIYLER